MRVDAESAPAALSAPLHSISRYAAAPRSAVSVDALDLRLLELLARDARTSRRKLAAELGMSAPAIGDRVNRLERLGVISGYTVRVDWSTLGYPTTVYLSIFAAHGHEQGKILQELSRIPEVEDVRLMTGAIDMLVRVRVRDYTHLRALLLEEVWQIEGIQRTETSLSIAEMGPKNTEAELFSMMLRLADQELPERSTTVHQGEAG